ncbi:MAG: ABC transporter permease subunit [Isosphaeraceae bacterium]
MRFGQTLESLVDQVRSTFVYLDLIALLTAALLGALAVSSEKEKGTWDGLLSTTPTGREIVLAKQVGVLWSLRWVLAGFATLWLIGLLGRAVSIPGVILSSIGLLAFTWSATALGVSMSILGRSSTRALLLTVAVLAVSQVVAFVPALILFERLHFHPAYSLTLTTPYLEWVALLGPNEAIFRPSAPVSAYASNPLFAARGGDIIPVVLLGNLAHLAAGSALTWVSIRLVDSPNRKTKHSGDSAVIAPRRPALGPGGLA